MFALMKELADRFIEFVLLLSKGEDVEARLTAALKSSIYLISALGCIIASLLVANLNQRVQLTDMEVGIQKVNLLFDSTAGGPIKGFLRINEALTDQNLLIKQENILLLKTSISLSEQNRWMKLQLLQLLDENKMLKENNGVIRHMCGFVDTY